MNSAQREKFLQLPALHPPPGVTPNFENPHNIVAPAKRRTFTIIILISVVVIMRLVTKFGVVRRVHLDDYILVIAWGAFMTNLVALIPLQNLNLGAHQWDIRYGELIEQLRYMYYITIISSIAIILLKAAIILQCLRVFCPPGVRGKIFYLLHALLWGNILFYTAMTLLWAFECSPIQKAWDVTVAGGHCMDRFQLRTATAIVNMVSDFLIVVIPQRAIWGLTIDRRKKVALAAVFLVGIAACVCAAMPLKLIFQSKGDPDVSYNFSHVGKWTHAEFLCGFAAACLPVFPKLYVFVRKQLFTKASSSRAAPGSQENVSYKKRGDRADGKHVISDLEFHELVIRPDQSSDAHEPQKNEGLGEPDYDTLAFVTQPSAKSPV